MITVRYKTDESNERIFEVFSQFAKKSAYIKLVNKTDSQMEYKFSSFFIRCELTDEGFQFSYSIYDKRSPTGESIPASLYNRSLGEVERFKKFCKENLNAEEIIEEKPIEITKSQFGDEAIYVIKNTVGDTLEVYNDYLILKHKGMLNFFAQGLKGDKRINYSVISAIEFRKATDFTNGYIQFTILGGSDRQGGTTSAASDENSILIASSLNDLATEVVNFIENRRIELSKPQVVQVASQTSTADELLKYKQLLDCGAITQEEFDSKKKELLNLN